MNRSFLIAGALFGLTAVILGAFGAHALKETLDAGALESYRTGVRYQMYHALLLLMIGGFGLLSGKMRQVVFYLLVFGILFFSGSIYLLAVFDFTGVALLTPFGGLLLISGWVVLLVQVAKSVKSA